MDQKDIQVRAEGIVKQFGAFTALAGLNLDIMRGEFLTLLGPSGSGKTTFLNILAGFEDPTEGRLIEDGKDITRRPADKRNFGMVFQGYALFPHMSVADNIAFPLRVRKRPREERDRKVGEMVEIVGLGGHAHKRPAQLSGGQQQRVALARALVFGPDVLLLDEPLSALDKALRETLQAELKRIHHEVGTTFVFVTHDQSEALAMSDRIAIFDHGRLRQLGPPAEVYARPQNRFVAEFLGKVNLFPLHGVAADGDGVTGRVGDTVLRAPGPLPAAGGQGDILLAVRPEHVRLAAAVGPDENRASAMVTDTTYQGPNVIVTMSVAGADRPISLTVPAGSSDMHRCVEGAAVDVVWPVAAGLLLPAEAPPDTEGE